ncbi:hypothetical protein [Acetobacter oeni]|uniref:hypothetical protein n=1 Tax=Acetobacter oeni TaxID=304077 RepID=UPI00160671F9|nr:hypothetical protein [Acetobacter oeni]MBB3883790.1 hypothetical protein [Acetobacter oeni]NHO19865.1 hypothetical protein [Acetobacter oeni]
MNGDACWEHFGRDTSVKPLDHTVGLRPASFGFAAIDTHVAAGFFKEVVPDLLVRG